MEPYISALDVLWEKVNGGSTSEVSSILSSVRSSVLATLHEALADPKTFVGFKELCAHPIIQSLLSSSEENEVLTRMLRTCELFSVGTWTQYRESDSGQYLDLGSTQIQKLKALSLITWIRNGLIKMKSQHEHPRTEYKRDKSDSTSIDDIMDTDERSIHKDVNDHHDSSSSSHDMGPKVIPYARLLSELDFKDIPSLEDFLIYCIYSKLVPPGSRLNPQRQCLMLACSLSSSTSSHAHTLGTERGFGAENPQTLFFSRDISCSWTMVGEGKEEQEQSSAVLAEMISTLEKIQNQGMGILEMMDTIQNQYEAQYHAQVQKWSDVDKRLEEVRTYSKSTFQNASLGSKWAGGMVGVIGSRGEDKREYKRSRGGGFMNY